MKGVFADDWASSVSPAGQARGPRIPASPSPCPYSRCDPLRVPVGWGMWVGARGGGRGEDGALRLPCWDGIRWGRTLNQLDAMPNFVPTRFSASDLSPIHCSFCGWTLNQLDAINRVGTTDTPNRSVRI
ncbi:MAG TPA: hypothetical protein VFU49_08830 [Ktedonobacteraceae bacterium]|nr:hypothetical protein [Ktedonobacteraceae bacterium]